MKLKSKYCNYCPKYLLSVFSLFHHFSKVFKYVFRFIKDGVDVNKRHTLGWTPLMVATVNEQYEAIELLLIAGADPNAADNFINANRTANQIGLHPIEGNFLKIIYVRQNLIPVSSVNDKRRRILGGIKQQSHISGIHSVALCRTYQQPWCH